MREGNREGLMALAVVLVSWCFALGFKSWNDVPLEEPFWRVSELKKFLESIPSEQGPEANGDGALYPNRGERLHVREGPDDVPIELNSADSAQLEGLPLIGPVLARRILKYREILGGFYHDTQLLEVYGLDSSAFAVVEPRVWVDAALIKTLCADTSSWSSLRRHPYIGVHGARLIERFRDAHTDMTMSQLATHPPIGDSLMKRWYPYLRVCGQKPALTLE